MDLAQTQDRFRAKKQQESLAVSLALDGKWEEAVQVNREILRSFPQDTEALNRLGKALLELGWYGEAREAFLATLQILPHNIIAKKNLERLGHLEESQKAPSRGKKVAPKFFIEESGKSATAELHRVASSNVLAHMAAGDEVVLRPRDHCLIVENQQGEYLGQLEPKLGQRILRLMKGGNQYSAVITSVKGGRITVILQEVYRHPSLAGVASFPSQKREETPLYLHDSLLLRSYLDFEGEGDGEGEGLAADWKEDAPFADVVDASGGIEVRREGEEEEE